MDKRLGIVLVAVLVLGTQAAHSQRRGAFTALAIDPQTPRIQYAGTIDRGVLKSVDDGATWMRTSLSGVWVTALAIELEHPATVYASTLGRGVFKSIDQGRTWRARNAGLPDLRVVELTIAPQSPTVLYAVVAENGVFKSTDGAETWTFSAAGCVPEDCTNGIDDDCDGLVDRADPDCSCGSPPEFACTNGLDDDCDGFIDAADVDCEPLPCGGDECPFGYLCFPDLFCHSHCEDGAPDFDESDSDCGGADCVRCGDGQRCLSSFDCQSGNCVSGICAPAGAPVLSSISVNPASVPGGAASVGTVTLSGAAPSEGAVIALSSSDPAVATVPASLTVPAGATSAAFSISTMAVTASTIVTIAGTYSGVTRTASLTVNAAVTLASLGLSPTIVTGGTSSTGTVTLSAAAPPGGGVIGLSSSDAAVAAVPPSVTVAAGGTSATFTISTNPVGASAVATISGTYSGVTRAAVLTLNPPTLSSVNLNPTSVPGGASSIGAVALNGPAPAGGADIALSSSDAAIAAVPPSVTVAPGATGATFTISTTPVAASTSITISASYDGVARSAVLTVTPPTVSSLSLNPTSVTGGASSIGNVTLSGPAPAGAAGIVLSSSDAAVATVAPMVTVVAGATSATFTVSTSACASGTVIVAAAYAGASRSAALTVTTTPDTVAIQAADYFRRKQLLRVEATSTTSTAALSVYETPSSAFIGTLTPHDGSRYRGEFTWPVNPQNITVRSDRCGLAASNVTVK